MPPNRESATRITGSRSGLYRSAWGLPLGPGEWTPPAVSTRAKLTSDRAQLDKILWIDARMSESFGIYGD